MSERADNDLADLDLFEVSDYAMMARYDLQFWPDEQTAADALALAQNVRRVVYELIMAAPPANEEGGQT